MDDKDKKLLALSEEEIIAGLKKIPGWQHEDDKITKTFEFGTFSAGVKLISDLAPFCDNNDHHPDIKINYKKVRFELTRYSIGGKITKTDFKVANKIEELYRNIS